jgi:aspartyl aminopeptidase
MDKALLRGLRAFLCLAVIALAVPRAAAKPRALGHKQAASERRGFAKAEVDKLAAGYMKFLSQHRTEREVVTAALAAAKKRGFRPLQAGKKGKPGARSFLARHGKIAAFAVQGKRPLRDGVHLVVAHVDAVRIDLKQTPIYADADLGLLETHYYGRIKPYQWLSLPLQLRGVVVTDAGKEIAVRIGARRDEPALVIPDLAVHLARYADAKEGEEIAGEGLDPVVSSTPAAGAGDRFALGARKALESQLGIRASDLASAELSLVPAHPVMEVGLDRGLVGGYGQDGRAGVYAALEALWQLKVPERTAIVLLVDKQEVGGNGNTGARSAFVLQVLAELLERSGVASTEAEIARVVSASTVVAAEFTAAANPGFAELYDSKNAPFVGAGAVLEPRSAHAEVLAHLRGLLRANNIAHQVVRWGKKRGGHEDKESALPHLTRLGMDGVELSMPLLSMHSPFELLSKADLYACMRAYRAFLAD